MDGFIRLVDTYGGTSNLYVPVAEQLVRPVRDELIRREYNGRNVYELARKWDLTDRSIREIVKDEVKKMRSDPGPDQLTFW